VCCVYSVFEDRRLCCEDRKDKVSLKNYKGFHSLTALAVADHQYIIRWVSDFFGGSNPDAAIWNASRLKKLMLDGLYPPTGTTAFRIGAARFLPQLAVDGTFSGDVVQKPYAHRTRRLNDTEKVHNAVHSRTRQLIEQVWGQVVARFPRYGVMIRRHGKGWRKRVIDQLMSAFVLHNVCKRLKDNVPNLSAFNRQRLQEHQAMLDKIALKQALRGLSGGDEVDDDQPAMVQIREIIAAELSSRFRFVRGKAVRR